MIVLDEHLLGRNIDGQIAQWYRGAVCFITSLQPNTVVKDENIPRLLQQEKNATFVTINEGGYRRTYQSRRRLKTHLRLPPTIRQRLDPIIR